MDVHQVVVTWFKQIPTWTSVVLLLFTTTLTRLSAQPVPGKQNVYGHSLVERVWGPDSVPRMANGKPVPIPRLTTDNRSWLDDGLGFPPGKLVAFHAFLCTGGEVDKGKDASKKSTTSPIHFNVWKIISHSPPTFKLIYTQRVLLPNNKKTLFTARVPDNANVVLTKPNAYRIGWTTEDSPCVICFNMTSQDYITHWEPVLSSKYPTVGDKQQFSAVPIPVQFSVAVEVETIGIVTGTGPQDVPDPVMRSRHHSVTRDRTSSKDEL